ncbi:BEL1-like homeodomain protein [Salvia divinorum]|uniref:BEL1-like homeodomain protein n=1 Tax=Salvia divinorum TaxID=28513 RepID=A0ABD1H1W3_SALDI
MAERFEAYHVPQRTRRDKLRVVNNQTCAALYDPSLISPDFLNFAAGMGACQMYDLNPTTIQDINVVFDHDGAASTSSGQSLSLSLSSNHTNLPLELNLQKGYDSPVTLSAVPMGPFTGYASLLKGSRFLKPAQQLLEELCDVGRGNKTGVDSCLLDDPPLESEIVNGGSAVDQTRMKSRLLSMLDQVYKRYKQYYQQMQAAVAAFESVAGLSGATPFANLALKVMSKHFTSLKNAITDQLNFTSKSHGKINADRDETKLVENSGQGSYAQRQLHAGFVDQPIWRPHRGLPERAVTVLRAWLFEHFLHPYPTDTDKIMLAKQTGLSRNQVSNWFINARVRLWKPMVEEIHMLETRQRAEGNDQLPTMEVENTSTSIQRSGDFPFKRCREDQSEAPRGAMGQQMKMPCDNLLQNPHHNMGVGLNNKAGGVSLTLGLNAARRFGLDSHGESYVVSGFAAQNRQFIDGQMLHDFVG